MSNYELLSIVIACIAAFISLLTVRSNRKLQQQSNDLQIAQAKLAEKQLEILLREDTLKNNAKVKLELKKMGSTSYKFFVSNISDIPAKNVKFELIQNKEECSPLINSELEEKLPIPVLDSGNNISFIAALSSDTPFAYNAVVSWDNPDGEREEFETYVAI
jgi:hypothetical protein